MKTKTTALRVSLAALGFPERTAVVVRDRDAFSLHGPAARERGEPVFHVEEVRELLSDRSEREPDDPDWLSFSRAVVEAKIALEGWILPAPELTADERSWTRGMVR